MNDDILKLKREDALLCEKLTGVNQRISRIDEQLSLEVTREEEMSFRWSGTVYKKWIHLVWVIKLRNSSCLINSSTIKSLNINCGLKHYATIIFMFAQKNQKTLTKERKKGQKRITYYQNEYH